MSNATEIECTYETCSIHEDGMIEYRPTLAGNAAYAGIFGMLLIAQLVLGIRYKTWGYLVGMICGLFLEIAGYIGRILLYDNVFEKNWFILYLVGLTIGPAFIAASIYLSLARIIYIFGLQLSFLKPKIITYIFILCDSVSLVLQSAGGAMTSIADTPDETQRGVDIMIAGLYSQVISLSIFLLLLAIFAWRVVKNPHKVNTQTLALRSTLKFKCFLIAILAAVILIQVRSVFRLAELQDGFDGSLANNELLFMIFEGPMIFIAVLGLTVFHPGLVVGREMWKEAKGASKKKTKDLQGPYKEVNDSEDSIPMIPQNAYSTNYANMPPSESYSNLGIPAPYGNGGIRGSREQL